MRLTDPLESLRTMIQERWKGIGSLPTLTQSPSAMISWFVSLVYIGRIYALQIATSHGQFSVRIILSQQHLTGLIKFKSLQLEKCSWLAWVLLCSGYSCASLAVLSSPLCCCLLCKICRLEAQGFSPKIWSLLWFIAAKITSLRVTALSTIYLLRTSKFHLKPRLFPNSDNIQLFFYW